MSAGARRERILHVGKYYPPVEGGIENHVQSLVEGLAERYDVEVLVFNTTRRTVRETVRGVRLTRAASLGRLLSTEISPSFLAWFVRLRHADLVHLHTPNPLGELACLLAPPKGRLLITYHSDVVRQKLLGRLNRLVLHRVMRRADKVIAFTRRYMESSPVLSRHAGKCAIIPHGVDLAELEQTPAVARRAEALRREHGPAIVLFVGRLVYYKGVDVLLRAMAAVPGARLLVAGDGPKRRSLQALCDELGLSDRVVFMGRIPHEEKVACYRAADLLVLPATHRSEAFGLVQVEALACGLPVVSTNIDSGVPFVNQHQTTGLVVEPEDPISLAGAITRILADPPMRERFSREGRLRAETLFSRDTMLRSSLSLYAELLDGPLGRKSPGGPLVSRVGPVESGGA